MMDEPTSALDVVAQRSLMTKIKELQRNLGFAVIFVTHDMSVVSRYSDRRDGDVRGPGRGDGADRAIFAQPLPPVHTWIDERLPVHPGPATELDRDPGQSPGLGPTTERMPVPSPLPTMSCRPASRVAPELYRVGE